MTKPLDLDRIKAYCEKATAGPWVTGSIPWKVWADGGGLTVCNVAACGDAIPIEEHPGIAWSDSMASNRDFIANARTDLPAAIAELAELRWEFERHRTCPECNHKMIPADCPVEAQLATARQEIERQERRYASLNAANERLAAEREDYERRNIMLDKSEKEMAGELRVSKAECDMIQAELDSARSDHDKALRVAEEKEERISRARNALEELSCHCDKEAGSVCVYCQVLSELNAAAQKKEG